MSGAPDGNPDQPYDPQPRPGGPNPVAPGEAPVEEPFPQLNEAPAIDPGRQPEPYPVNDPGIVDPSGPGSEPDILPGGPTNPMPRF